MMSVSQNLLAFFTAETRPAGLPGNGLERPSTAAAEGLGSFAEVLASQQPEQVRAFFDSLDPSGLAAIDSMPLAADGKVLPEGMQDWLEQLSSIDTDTVVPEGEVTVDADPEAIATVAEQWMQWLNDARAAQLGDAATEQAEPETGEHVVSGPAGEAPVAASGDPAVSEADLAARRGRAVSAEGGGVVKNAEGIDQGRAEPGKMTGQEDASQASRRGQSGNPMPMDSASPTQRVAAMAGGVEGQAAFAGKLAEQSESSGLRRSASDAESLDAATRPGAGAGQAAQAALTARPVAAPTQSLGVPFGQPSWSEAMVEKVMWMSSQNLRSVEIHLDPAELGRLEIHIQSRGQEHQVQFISQNPSVREALEAQVFRLREMFSQQGMDQPSVSVADSAVGQHGRDAQGELAGDGRRSRADQLAGGQEAEDAAASLMTSTAGAMAASDRLVDFYA